MNNNQSASEKITCRAAVAWKPNEPLKIETIEVDPPKAGEVRIKILYTAICHTDVFALAGEDPNHKFPLILGHEAAGIVESVGPGVESVKVGDHVLPSPLPQCRKCTICTNPKANICKEFLWGKKDCYLMRDGTTRFSCRGQPINHFIGLSTFSEYSVCMEIAVCKINPKAPLDRSCLVGCGVTTGYGAPINSVVVGPEHVVGVWGLGAIGLSVIMGAKAQGAKYIIGLDLNPKRFDKALLLGANECINPSEVPDGKTLSQYFYERFDGGFDAVFEATGDDKAMRQAFECTKMSTGQTCIMGATANEIKLNAGVLLVGRTIRGCIVGGFKPRDDMPRLVEKYMEGNLNLDAFISWRYDLNDINEGIKRLNNGEGVRSVISMASNGDK